MSTNFFTFLKSFDVVFPVLHGQFGEDGTIQGLLEMAQIPYVGCRVMASCTAMDKIYAKKLFDQANIPQVPSLYVKKRYDDKLVNSNVSIPLIHFSIGIFNNKPI